ncbi:MAG TPA: SDR family oxidoreductase [Acidocella sp.]|jgi:NAD(P)-dependent dehydrogenase (short-subunit alcohol dehydrogenase family)|nr:SDR family oxidoreductase [Acidocella sp.]
MMQSTPFDLTGKTALVTGGGRGIGAGIARVLANAGANVVIADIDLASAQSQAAALHEGCGAARIDLADENSIAQGCAETIARFGVPWLLVNNAALLDRELLLDATSDQWDRTLAVNARGPYLMSRDIARAMVAQGGGGRIVNIASASIFGSITFGHAAYASSKAALLGLTRASALELASHGITVNLVLPGGVATQGAINARGPAPQGPACRPPPLGLCEPEDIGHAVLFFASPAAARITNQAVAVDGGWSVT